MDYTQEFIDGVFKFLEEHMTCNGQVITCEPVRYSEFQKIKIIPSPTVRVDLAYTTILKSFAVLEEGDEFEPATITINKYDRQVNFDMFEESGEGISFSFVWPYTERFVVYWSKGDKYMERFNQGHGFAGSC